MKNINGFDKANKTFSFKLKSMKKKWMRDQNNLRLLKFESKQLHHLCDKMLSDGRLTLGELRFHVNSRQEAKQILKLTD